MATQDFKRKLTAILSADVAGYSRLMGEDDEATVRTITAYREVISQVVQKHNGRVVDSPGDNILADFASAFNAVSSAIEIQETLKEKNADLPDNRKMKFRIGINLGDIILEGNRIYGDGVNVAARIEGLTDPGGVCISRNIYDQVKKKLTNLGYEYIGAHDVKNISEPVRVYKLLMEPEYAGKLIGEETPKPAWSRTLTAALVIFAIVACGLAVWNFYTRRSLTKSAAVEKMAFPLPEKPSLAVLPFDNLSGDSKQEYFSDGITESIITALSNVSNLFVIARNSTFTYKGKPVKVQQVAQELGVRFVLEGSVQRSEDRIRITVQLIDALSGHHLWAEQYDREFGEIFALQDDITERVAMTLKVKLTEGEQARIRRRHIENKEAYEYFLRGQEIYRIFTKENNDQARKLFEKTVALDPNSALGWSWIGWTHYRDGRFGWTDTPDKSLKLAEELAQKVLAMDDSMAEAHSILSLVYMARKQHDKAVAFGEKVLSLAPNFASMIANTALIFVYSGRPEEAVELVKKAMRLSPYYPSWYLPILGLAYRLTGQCEAAIVAFEGYRKREARGMLPHIFLAFTYVEAGREEDAQAAVAEALRQNPKASIEGYAATIPYKDPAEIERVKASLRKAGLPETPPLPLPDKPSIAVLPFVNMSGDPKQEYFSDGLTEEIITALSKVRRLFVIARNSTFTYKGKPLKVQQIGRELGVRFVLEGSVRWAGDKVRISAQLIDATTGNHLWAERYDRNLTDIFAVQDEVTKKIITAMNVELTEGEQAQLAAKATDNLGAYLKFMQSRENIYQFSIESIASAKQLAEEAVALDPKYASAYRILGVTHMHDALLGTSKSPNQSMTKAIQLVKKAIELDDTNGYSHAVLGFLFLLTKQYDQAIAEADIGITLNPNAADIHAWRALTLLFMGRSEEALREYKKAIRINPIPPSWYIHGLAMTYCWVGRYEEAIMECEKAIRQEPNSLYAHLAMTVIYSLSGNEEKARSEAAEVIRIHPRFSLNQYEKRVRYKNQVDTDRYMGALRKAGLK